MIWNVIHFYELAVSVGCNKVIISPWQYVMPSVAAKSLLKFQ